MIFTSPEFVLFALAFFAAFAVLRGAPRRWLLLAAGWGFYAAWDVRFLPLLVGSTLLDYVVALRLPGARSPNHARWLVGLSLAGNLGTLAAFKYIDFFLGGVTTAVGWFGGHAAFPALGWVLPVGISFYTFQSLSYTLDVYRGAQQPTRSFLAFANYVAFFPQLVAGPIERASKLLPAMAAVGRQSWRPEWCGITYIAIGAFKKVVLADNLAPFVDLAYADPAAAWGPGVALATLVFAAQIYCDFSGYSDLAVGLARLLGIDLVHNFRAPYGADGPRDFWRRWHVSLSTWLRDYLYLPVGGDRGGRRRTARNLLLTMLLGGLWHGAAANFVLWGAYHGAWLVLARTRLGVLLGTRLPALARRGATFLLVCLGWSLFRADGLSGAATVLVKLCTPWRWDLAAWLGEARVSGEGRALALAVGITLAIWAWHTATRCDTREAVDWLERRPFVVRSTIIALLLAACLTLAPEAPPPFIYFQF